MGLSSFPCSAEGLLPLLVMNTVLSVALLKNTLRSALQAIGAASSTSQDFEEQEFYGIGFSVQRSVSTTHFRSHRNSNINGVPVECCVCLCGFEEGDEVSELSCTHFFHKSCLEKWFMNKQSTCPLCRSTH